MSLFTRTLIIGAAALALSACSESTKVDANKAAEGAADDTAANLDAAGNKIEQAGDNAVAAIETAGDKAETAIDKAGDKADAAAQAAKEKTGEAMEKTGQAMTKAGEKLPQ